MGKYKPNSRFVAGWEGVARNNAKPPGPGFNTALNHLLPPFHQFLLMLVLGSVPQQWTVHLQFSAGAASSPPRQARGTFIRLYSQGQESTASP